MNEITIKIRVRIEVEAAATPSKPLAPTDATTIRDPHHQFRRDLREVLENIQAIQSAPEHPPCPICGKHHLPI